MQEQFYEKDLHGGTGVTARAMKKIRESSSTELTTGRKFSLLLRKEERDVFLQLTGQRCLESVALTALKPRHRRKPAEVMTYTTGLSALLFV